MICSIGDGNNSIASMDKVYELRCKLNDCLLMEIIKQVPAWSTCFNFVELAEVNYFSSLSAASFFAIISC